MKALTLTPPWGTLVAFHEKQVETRSWGTTYRGPIAIHQAKSANPAGGELGLRLLLSREPFKSVLRAHLSGYTIDEMVDDLPRGYIVATAQLVDVVPTAGNLSRALERHFARKPLGADTALAGDVLVTGAAHEADFGDYSVGRYAWILTRVVNLYDGEECRGGRGLWDVPADVVARPRGHGPVSYVSHTEFGEVRRVTTDGTPTLVLVCPGCGEKGELDDDQARGRVSVAQGCAGGYHETHDFWTAAEQAGWEAV